jgi:carbohydrate-binding DOMON domain-containing protein
VKIKAQARRGTEMSKIAGQPLPNALIRVVDLLVESRIRIDAMEQILVKTNAVAYELYLSTVENLQTQKAAEVTRILTQTLKSRSTER